MAIYPHLSLEGTRITTLAARMEISKQAVGQVVEELEQMGLVRRVPDPSDGRAKLVKFTAAGREGMLRGLGLLETIEQELAIALGEKQIQNMGRTLRKVLSHLEG
ncbi:MAG: winged helix DNA-binding protein [Myxococcales bacterium]|nr:winged helix DNA-binding protein [Myxococcales bacterium]